MGRRTLGFVAIMLVTTWCSGADSQPNPLPKGCTERFGDETYFIGERRCLATLPREELSGYWVSGHEHSVYFSDKQSIRHMLSIEDMQLSLSDEAEAAVKSVVRPGEWQVFAIRFIGAKTTMRGVYGPGPYKGGVLVTRILEIREIAPKKPASALGQR